MQETKVRQTTVMLPTKKTLLIVSVIFVLLLIAIYAIFSNHSSLVDALPPGTVVISQKTLEEKYGLHVNLIAVTAAGGFVDVRLKILDGEKAKALLTDSNNFPSLFAEGSVILSVSDEVKQQEIQFEEHGNLFIMFANARDAVKPGNHVRLLFGILALEPLDVQ